MCYQLNYVEVRCEACYVVLICVDDRQRSESSLRIIVANFVNLRPTEKY